MGIKNDNPDTIIISPEEIINQEEEDILLVPVETGHLNKLTNNGRFITNEHRLIFLSELGKQWNMTRAALKTGFTRQAFIELMERDEKFNQSVMAIKNTYLDQIENVSAFVACDPTHKGYNDRKLQLEAHRRKEYGRSPEVAIQVNNITINNADNELRRLIGSFTNDDK